MLNSLKRKEIIIKNGIILEKQIWPYPIQTELSDIEKLQLFFNRKKYQSFDYYVGNFDFYDSNSTSILIIPIVFYSKTSDGKIPYINIDRPQNLCISYLCIKFNNNDIKENSYQLNNAKYSIISPSVGTKTINGRVINIYGLIIPNITENTDTELKSIQGFEEVEDGDGNTRIIGKVGCKKNLTYYFFINSDDKNPIIYNTTDYFYAIAFDKNSPICFSSSLFTNDVISGIMVFNENCPFLPTNFKDYMTNDVNNIKLFHDNDRGFSLINGYNFYNGENKDILLGRWFSKSTAKDNINGTRYPYNLDDCYYCHCYEHGIKIFK